MLKRPYEYTEKCKLNQPTKAPLSIKSSNHIPDTQSQHTLEVMHRRSVRVCLIAVAWAPHPKHISRILSGRSFMARGPGSRCGYLQRGGSPRRL